MKMYDGEADTWNGVDYPISSEVRSNWINVTPSGMEDQSVTGLHASGYIRGNSSATFYMYSDFSDTPVVEVSISGSDAEGYIFSGKFSGSLGEIPLGLQPLGSVESEDEDGLKRFRFTLWFPDIYCTYLSYGWKSTGQDEYIELNQIGITVSADPLSVAPGLIKS